MREVTAWSITDNGTADARIYFVNSPGLMADGDTNTAGTFKVEVSGLYTTIDAIFDDFVPTAGRIVRILNSNLPIGAELEVHGRFSGGGWGAFLIGQVIVALGSGGNGVVLNIPSTYSIDGLRIIFSNLTEEIVGQFDIGEIDFGTEFTPPPLLAATVSSALISYSMPAATWSIDSAAAAAFVTPASALSDSRPALPCRISGPTSGPSQIKLTATFDAPMRARVACVLGGDMPPGTVVTVSANMGTFSRLMGSDTLRILENGAVGVFLVLPDHQYYESDKFDFEFAHDNIASNVFDIGEIWIAPAIALGRGIKRDWSDGLEDNTEDNRSESGQPYTRVQLPARTLNMSYEFVSSAQTHGDEGNPEALNLRFLRRQLDRHQTCVVIPRWTDKSGDYNSFALHYSALFGFCKKLPALDHGKGDFWSQKNFLFIEYPAAAYVEPVEVEA